MSQHPITLHQCPLAQAMQLLDGRWRLVILNFLRQQPLRFNELERRIGDVSPKMLISALNQLETDGLIRRNILQQKPLKVSYALTDKGHKCIPVLDALIEFGLAINQPSSNEPEPCKVNNHRLMYNI